MTWPGIGRSGRRKGAVFSKLPAGDVQRWIIACLRLCSLSSKRWMIYGAGGFSGRLIAAEAARRGYRPILAGRRAETVASLAAELGCPYRVFPLRVAEQLASHLTDVALVLNCAGPFSLTARPLVEACLAAGVHYLDITGEFRVIEELAALGEEARNRGILILPAVGFGVVPSDCLAAQLAECFPEATHLRIAFTADRSPSRGTAKKYVGRFSPGDVYS